MADFQSVVNAGSLIGEPKMIPGGGGFAVIPEGSRLEDLRNFMPAPAYAKAEVKARTYDALTAYVSRHRTDATAIFADVDAGCVTAIIDYHAADNSPAHAAHRVVYAAPFSQEWRVWTGADGKKSAQTDFARFIEENRADIVSPDGATMLEIARDLDARKKVNFKSAVRLQDGTVDLAYSEETTSATSGKVSIPQEIEIGIPVFYGGDRYKVKAFFRYRIEDGRLFMWVDLHRVQHVRDAAFGDIMAKIGDACPGVPLYEAAP